MPVIPVKLDDVVEMRPVPFGRYNLQVVSCEMAKSKKGKDQYDMSIAIEGHDNAPNIRHFVSLPSVDDEQKAFRFKVLMLKRLCRSFGIPLSGDSIDTDAIAMELVGAKASNVEVTAEKETDENGNEKPGGRTFNRINFPLLPDEQGQASGGSGRKSPAPPKR